MTKQGNGAVFEPVLFEGKIVEVNILSRGEDYSQGIKVLVTDDSYSGDDGFKTKWPREAEDVLKAHWKKICVLLIRI